MGRQGVWTGKRLKEISEQLELLDIHASPNTVRRLLQKLGYALHANRKSLSGATSPDRNRQFKYLDKKRKEFAQNKLPVISVDTKKKELVGCFKNPGQVWSREATPVNDHDFRSQADGMAVPYGIYDVQANRGSVLVGNSHDTPEFAVDAIVFWWREEGLLSYAKSPELLILADGGGSNGSRCRLWKYALQEKLVDPYNLRVTVCHYPTGASKWNPIEHRLFSEISKHWAGQPLINYPTVVQLIGETRTQTGLKVKCSLTTVQYSTGVKITDKQMAQLNLQKHAVLPDRNYTLFPRNNRN